MEKGASILVTGHRGMVGSSLIRLLQNQSYQNIQTASSSEADLRSSQQAEDLFGQAKPDYVFLCAAKVGGIQANSQFPAEFIYDNLMIAANVVQAAYKFKVKGLLFFGSSCIYPKLAPQPMGEDILLEGKLEPTNEPYAIAKIAGIKLCESYNRQYGTNFRSIMPTNLYGPKDNFHLENSHVIAAMIRKFHLAKLRGEDRVSLWGTGKPRREFIYVDDLAAAAIFVMKLPRESWLKATSPMNSHLNVGSGKDISIYELANIIQEIVRFRGKVEWDASMPDGTPRKLLDVSRLAQLGWRSRVSLDEGLSKTYDWFCDNYDSLRI